MPNATSLSRQIRHPVLSLRSQVNECIVSEYEPGFELQDRLQIILGNAEEQ
jgi:hypothetical protein